MRRYFFIVASIMFVGLVVFVRQGLAANITPTTAEIGEGCVASGVNSTAMGKNTTASGRDSTSMGSFTTASDFSSTAMGSESTASGYTSTAMGLETTASGDYSTAMGLVTIASGYNSTAMGFYSIAGADYSFAGGKYMRLTEAAKHTFVWGYSDTPQDISTPNAFLIFPAGTSGSVGIGTKSPEEKVHIGKLADTRGAAILLDSTGVTSGRKFFVGSTLSGNVGGAGLFQIYDATGGGPRFNIDAAGNVGIGTTSPNYKLDVRGTIGNNTTLYHSDRRWKKDIQPLDDSLDKIMGLRGVSFRWKTEEFKEMTFPDGSHIGLIAQEVETVVPEVVQTDNQGYKSVEYANLVPLLIEAIKEQQKQIDQLKARLEQLTGQN